MDFVPHAHSMLRGATMKLVQLHTDPSYSLQQHGEQGPIEDTEVDQLKQCEEQSIDEVYREARASRAMIKIMLVEPLMIPGGGQLLSSAYLQLLSSAYLHPGGGG
jgi:hypothetical protein